MSIFSSQHEILISQCCKIAAQGLGGVSPNPLVGALLVAEGRIIGEGFHETYGGSHAEVQAIDSVETPELLKKATLYVNLEPCAHHGKTPPCTTLIKEMGIPRVVFGTQDPNPLVSGRGTEALMKAGIEVVSGILPSQCWHLNRRFFTNIKELRPYVILKWAETRDGFIARPDYSSRWISSEQSRIRVHQWRSEEDAILVGTTTALKDNPQLSVRSIVGRNPIRILVDRDSTVPKKHHIFDGSEKTIIISHKKPSAKNLDWIPYPDIGSHADFWAAILPKLYEAKIGSLIIEGGNKILTSVIQAGLWDEARIFRSSQEFKEGIPAPILNVSDIDSRNLVSQSSGSDQLDILEPLSPEQ